MPCAANGEIVYRVNDAIYTARITGTHLGKRKLVVKESAIPDVHWVFWKPPQR